MWPRFNETIASGGRGTVSCSHFPSPSGEQREGRPLERQAKNDRERAIDLVQLIASQHVVRLTQAARSIAPICSTMTRVRAPSIATSGLNDAGRAWVEVGAMMTVDRASNSLA